MFKLEPDGDGCNLSGDDASGSDTSLGFPTASDVRRLRLSVEAAADGISAEFARSNEKRCEVYPSKKVPGAVVVEGINGSWVRIAKNEIPNFTSLRGLASRIDCAAVDHSPLSQGPYFGASGGLRSLFKEWREDAQASMEIYGERFRREAADYRSGER